MVQPEAKPGDSVDTEPTPHRFASLAASPSKGGGSVHWQRFINLGGRIKIDPKGSVMDRDKLGQSVFTGLVVAGIVAVSTALAEPRHDPRGELFCGTPFFSKGLYPSRFSGAFLAENPEAIREHFKQCLNPQPPSYCNAHPDPGIDPQTTREHWDQCLADGVYDDC